MMNNFEVTVENGVITLIKNYNEVEMIDEYEHIELFEIEGNLFIPKDATAFAPEVLIGVSPENILVESGNPAFFVKGNCLFSAETGALIMACKNSVIPNDGSVRVIGESAFSWPIDLSEMQLDPLRIPDSVRKIEYRAFALTSANSIHIVVPTSVERVDAMAFMLKSGTKSCTVTFEGSPQLEAGVFGTNAEAADSQYEAYRQMPDILYTQPDELLVRAPKDSLVIAYCEKYGIRCKVI